MKKKDAVLIVLALLACLLGGCGMMIVEDAQPVVIGLTDRTLTEVC